MTLDRHALAERLRPHLSPTEPRLASELLVLAGVQTGSRVGGTVAAALQELRAAGHARPAGGTRQALRWLASAPGDLGSETLPLARLDATLTLTTTARTTAGGTRRTELAATVTLGPSWPATTPTPPRWSTAFSDAQVAGGALAGARTNAIARAEAQLRALRKGKTLPTLPTEEPVTNRPNPLLLPSKNREAFFSYLASVQPDGARCDSACTRLATLGLATTTAEAERWLDEAVEQGLLAERTKRASDGTTVVRYLPVEPTTPAPLPKSSAPAEEAPAAPVEPKAKPAREARIGKDTYRGAPPKPRPAPVDDPAEHDSEDPPQVEESGEVARLTRERDEMERKWKDVLGLLDSGLGSGDDMRLRFCSALSLSAQVEWPAILGRVRDVRDEHARLADRLATLTTERDDLALRRERTEIHRYHLAAMVGIDGGAPWEDVLVGVARALQRRETRHPTTYQGDPAEQFATSIAGWLVGLSDETWLEVTRARHQLAESKRLREQSHSLELRALDALDRAVGARPAAPLAPAPTPEPEPAVEATAQPTPLARVS